MTLYYPSQDGQREFALGSWEQDQSYLQTFGVAGVPCGVAFQLATGITYSGATLTLSYSELLLFEGQDTAPIQVWLEDSLAPSAWSNSNLPVTAMATLLASLTVPTVPTPLVFDVAAAVLARSSAPGWSGRLAFVIASSAQLVYGTLWSSEHATLELRPVLSATASGPEPEPEGGGSRRLVLPIWPEPDTSILP